MAAQSIHPGSGPAHIVLNIEGMMCQQNCAMTVSNTILTSTYVHSAIVSYAMGQAEIWLNPLPSDVSLQTMIKHLVDEVESVGYGASLLSVADVPTVQVESQSSIAAVTAINDREPSSDEIEVNYENFEVSDHVPADCVVRMERSLHGIEELRKVEQGLLAVDGVVTVEVVKQEVHVWGFADPYAIVQALKRLGLRSSCITGGFSPATESISSFPDVNTNRHRFTFAIQGMSCGNCANKVEKTLCKLSGVKAATVSIMTNQALVVVDEALAQVGMEAVGPRDIIQKIETLGYRAQLLSTDERGKISAAGGQDQRYAEYYEWRNLLIFSLIFGLPVILLHFSMQFIPIVMEYAMEPTICYGSISLGQLCMIVLNTPLLLLVGQKFYRAAWMGMLNGSLGMDFLVVTGTSIAYLYSLMQVFLACEYQHDAVHLFFETSGMLLTFVTTGKFIESYAKGKSASATEELLKLQPQEALLVTGETAFQIIEMFEANKREDCKRSILSNTLQSSSGSSQYVLQENSDDVNRIAVNLVQKGDVIKVLPGERIPTDGLVIFGSSHVDESMITGESIPVEKSRGMEVFGSTVNQENCLYIRVTSYGADSALAQIVHMVEAAQMQKAPVQQYADKVAAVFTPVVLLMALTTFLIWFLLALSHLIPKQWYAEEYGDPTLFALLFATSVVVISCPCALGLATPTAIMVGTTVGAKNGILFKGGEAFEIAQKVDTVVFDKTGTLTIGKPVVTDEVPITGSPGSYTQVNKKPTFPPNLSEHRVLLIAATAEQRSSHPLAVAITNAASALNLSLYPVSEEGVINVVGSGVTCSCSIGNIHVGNRAYMKENKIVLASSVDTVLWDLEIQGKTAVLVALEREIIGAIGIADVLKPEANAVILALEMLGVNVWMLTGDNATTATALASKLDIPEEQVLAGVLPSEKAQKVQELQANGHVVMMVGDGINDSPALVQADVGVAIGAGTHIAIESATMVLIRSDLKDLVVALDLAKYVFARIKTNFWWAAIYNMIALPFAAGVFFPWTKMILPPHYAGLAMAMSSISVIISSILLKFYHRPEISLQTLEFLPLRDPKFTCQGWVHWFGSTVIWLISFCSCCFKDHHDYTKLHGEEEDANIYPDTIKVTNLDVNKTEVLKLPKLELMKIGGSRKEGDQLV